jgi:hypothetical protein
VRKLVPISANYRSDGYYPELLAGLAMMTPDIFAGTPQEAAYLRHAPNPEDFPALVEKRRSYRRRLPSEGRRRGDRGADAAWTLRRRRHRRPEHACGAGLFRLPRGVPAATAPPTRPSSSSPSFPTAQKQSRHDRARAATDLLLAMLGPFSRPRGAEAGKPDRSRPTGRPSRPLRRPATAVSPSIRRRAADQPQSRTRQPVTDLLALVWRTNSLLKNSWGVKPADGPPGRPCPG